MGAPMGLSSRDSVRTPLGVVGLFIVLVYAIGSLAFTLQSDVSEAQRWVLVVFVVVFPVVVLGVFLFLVTRAFGRLYAPSDFRSDEAFLDFTRGFSRDDTIAKPQVVGPPLPNHAGPSQEAGIDFTPAELDALLLAVHGQQLGLFLGHVVSPDPRQDHVWEVAIFVTGWGPVDEVKKAEFYFGSAWGRRILESVPDDDGKVGIVVRANNGFVALCKVTLSDGREVFLNHYCNLGPGEGIGDEPFRARMRRWAGS